MTDPQLSPDYDAESDEFCPTCGALDDEACCLPNGAPRANHKARRTRPLPPGSDGGVSSTPERRDPVDMADACLASWLTPSELQMRHDRDDHEHCPPTWCEAAAIYKQADDQCRRPHESSVLPPAETACEICLRVGCRGTCTMPIPSGDDHA